MKDAKYLEARDKYVAVQIKSAQIESGVDAFEESIVKHEAALAFDAGASHILQRAEIKGLVASVNEMNSWLRRMTELYWHDPTYAPNFKACVKKNEEALEKFNQMKGNLK